MIFSNIYFNLILIISSIFSYYFLSFVGLFFSLLFSFIFFIPLVKDNTSNFLKNKKHGINQDDASRLGGVIVSLMVAFTTFFYYYESAINFSFYLYTLFGLFLLIGLVDDLKLFDFNSKFKLISQILILTFVFLISDLLLINFEKSKLLYFVNFSYMFKFLISFIVVLVFINASNIIDGANGLLSGTAIIILFIFYIITNNDYFNLLLLCFIIFFLYNFFTGKIFLGDTGSYLIGIIIISSTIFVFNNYTITVCFVLSLFSYIICELFNSFFRRVLNNKDPFVSDNDHLHNLLFKYLNKFKLGNLITNSLNGFILLLMFPIVDLFIYLSIDLSKSQFMWIIFIFHIFQYLYLRKILNKL